MGFGFSSSKSSSKSYIDPAQQPFLDFLRNSGAAMAGSAMPLADRFGREQGAALYGQGQQFLGGLQSNPYLTSLQGMSQFDPSRVQSDIDVLGMNIGRQWQQNILPGIDSQYQGIGAFGGGRNQVTRGVAAGQMQQDFMSGVNDIVNNERMRNLQAAGTGGGLYSQGLLGGLSQMPGLFNMGLSQFTGGFAPLMMLDQIVGAPTVLNSSRNRSTGFSIGGLGGKDS